MLEERVSSSPSSLLIPGEPLPLSSVDDPTKNTKRYDVTIKRLAMTLAVTTGLLFTVSTAQAKAPLDVDCDLLEATNDAVNDFLDEEGIQFDNLGDLISSSILDDEVFAQLSALVTLFSDGEINFDSASQAVSTNARCGLIPQLIGNVND